MTYEAPNVVVHDVHEYSTLQPAYEVLPRLPMRAIAVGPSGSGETVFITSLIADLLRTRSGSSCFLHIYVWSPSFHVDPVWETVKDYAKQALKHEDDCFYEQFHSEDLQAVIDKQQKLIASLKQRGAKCYRIFSCALMILRTMCRSPAGRRYCINCSCVDDI